LVKTEGNSLRVAAMGKPPKAWFLGQRRAGLAAGLANAGDRSLDVAHFEEKIDAWFSVAPVQADPDCRSLEPAALGHRLERPAEHMLEEAARGLRFSSRRAELNERNVAVHTLS
jgi:hypothetical protein